MTTERGLAFPLRLDAEGRVAFSTGDRHLRERLTAILSTERGERVMRPAFGAGLGRFLFRQNTAATHRLIEEAIVQAVGRWEPGVAIEGVEVGPDPGDPDAALATLRYRALASGTAGALSVSVPLS